MATASLTEAEIVERYIELDALEVLVTSSFALGGVLLPHLTTVGPIVEEHGLDLQLGDDGPSLQECFDRVIPDDIEEEGDPREALIHARTKLLIAKMLRSITPEDIVNAADHFESGAERMLRRFDLGDGFLTLRDAEGGDAA